MDETRFAIWSDLVSLRVSSAMDEIAANWSSGGEEAAELVSAGSFSERTDEYTAVKDSLSGRSPALRMVGRWEGTLDGTNFSIKGRLLEDADTVFLFVNFRLVRLVSLASPTENTKRDRKFEFVFRKSLLLALPERSIISIGTSAGWLSCSEDDDRAIGYTLCYPGADGSLFNRLDSTFHLNKNGMLQERLSENPRWQRGVTRAAKEFSNYFQARFGYKLFLFYGTLLGFCRDGDFIDKDDDLDLAFISRQTSAELVRDEMFRLSRQIVLDGYKLASTSVFIKPRVNGFYLDVFPGWHDGGMLLMPNTTFLKSDEAMFFPLRGVRFKERDFLVPNQSELFLARKYGENWRIPDLGYRCVFPGAAREQLVNARLTDDQQSELRALADEVKKR